ncbi:hypothetical protein ACGF07_07820 [Kitasatospora sp. NPDC048194]|uniref:hypothetical protein n=1 Tax=Kitasatospora sp. NPDC048194 TaxID=3364045 RepID=UPI00371A4101
MSKRPAPRRVRINGEALVVLSEREYESLLATRRQVGASNARLRALQHALTEALARLAASDNMAPTGDDTV